MDELLNSGNISKVLDKLLTYLILAHEYGTHEARLIQRLRRTGNVLMHMDAKFGGAIPRECIGKREVCSWGQFSLVRAEVALLRAALDTGANQFILVCGKSYPMWADNKLEAYFSEPRDFLKTWNLRSHPRELFGKLHYRIFSKWCIDRDQSIAQRLASKLSYLLPTPAALAELPLRFGGQFIGLCRSTTEKVIKLIDARPELFEAFAHAWAPDEIALHSLAAAVLGEAGGSIPRFFWQVRQKPRELGFINVFSQERHPLHVYVEHREVLEQHLRDGSPFPFGRKFSDADEDLRTFSDNL